MNTSARTLATVCVTSITASLLSLLLCPCSSKLNSSEKNTSQLLSDSQLNGHVALCTILPCVSLYSFWCFTPHFSFSTGRVAWSPPRHLPYQLTYLSLHIALKPPFPMVAHRTSQQLLPISVQSTVNVSALSATE